MKFKFTGEYEPMPFQDAIASKRKIEFEAESLGSILEQFEMFLRGCGYVFEGHIDIVDDFAENTETTEFVDEDDLDDVNQFFDRARAASKKLDEPVFPFADSKEIYEQGGDPAHPPSYQPKQPIITNIDVLNRGGGYLKQEDPSRPLWDNKIE
jgi:hypothetical protein